MDAMLAEAPGPINFTVFLNMLADKLHGTDSEEVIGNAFKVGYNLTTTRSLCQELKDLTPFFPFFSYIFK